MIKKVLFFILITFSLSNCGYSPIYSEKNNTDFEIVSFKIEGNNQINNIAKNRLQKYFNNDSEKKYKIFIKTNYEKISAAKDLTGNTTNINLKISLSLNYIKMNLEDNSLEKTVLFSKNQIIKRNENNYEQNNYEKILIENMSQLLIDKVILHLSRD
tara:strand:+ start:3369 stop:3839 length:471 start_codon:yes stop_codon:yes gene_type:complete